MAQVTETLDDLPDDGVLCSVILPVLGNEHMQSGLLDRKQDGIATGSLEALFLTDSVSWVWASRVHLQ